MDTLSRVKTGIAGLDDLIEGGFPKGRLVLISGACGTGKSIFSLQYIYNGAAKYNEPGIYVTLDERPEILREDASRFGWDLKKYEDQGLLRIIDGSIARIGYYSEEKYSLTPEKYDLDKLILEIISSAKDMGAKRVAIDSLPAMRFIYTNEDDARSAILKIGYTLLKAGLTTVMTTEIDDASRKLSKFGVEEFVADGVILLTYNAGLGKGNGRNLIIRKMRGTNHSEDTHSLQITNEGISIVNSFSL